MNIMVTGASGFIGQKLIELLSKENHTIFAISRKNIESCINNNVKWICCSMEEIGKITETVQEKLDICFHLAWEGNSGNTRGSYEIQLKNIENSIKLVHCLSEIGCKKFVGAGTLAEYDVEKYFPMDGSEPNLTSEYGIAKLATRYFTKAECSNCGIEHIWCFLTNTYGEGNYTNNFINFAAKRMLSGERASFTEAKQLYDFMYVTDTVRAIYLAGIKGKKNSSYYLGSGNAKPLRDYIIELRDVIDKNIELYFGEIPFQGSSLEKSSYDCKKLFEDTGFVPKVDFSEGIKKTVLWLKEERMDNDSAV